MNEISESIKKGLEEAIAHAEGKLELKTRVVAIDVDPVHRNAQKIKVRRVSGKAIKG